jgi:hypothetical protein
MKLYHGTTEAVARIALDEGLCPRGESGVTGNWEHSVPSGADRVYLTTGYAPYFAFAAQPEEVPIVEQVWAVVEVETDRLEDPDALCPDEDWLEQGSRGPLPEGHWLRDIGLQDCATVKERTVLLREWAPACSGAWEASVKGLGTCAHVGCIPPEAITRVSLFEPKHHPEIAHASLDPLISILNYSIVGAKYRAITRWFFEAVEPQDIFSDPLANHPGVPEEHRRAMRRQAEKARSVVEHRAGITVIEGAGA